MSPLCLLGILSITPPIAHTYLLSLPPFSPPPSPSSALFSPPRTGISHRSGKTSSRSLLHERKGVCVCGYLNCEKCCCGGDLGMDGLSACVSGEGKGARIQAWCECSRSIITSRCRSNEDDTWCVLLKATAWASVRASNGKHRFYLNVRDYSCRHVSRRRRRPNVELSPPCSTHQATTHLLFPCHPCLDGGVPSLHGGRHHT